MHPLITTFATADAHYQRHAERLAGQLRGLGIAFHVEHLAQWTDNKREACCYRPKWIREQLDTHGPLMWFDVDGDILAPIDIPEGYDVGLATNPPFWRHKRPENPVTAGLMYFADTQGARAFLDYWALLCAAWRPGEPGSHHRLCQTRDRVAYREMDLTPYVTGKVILRGAKGQTEVAL